MIVTRPRHDWRSLRFALCAAAAAYGFVPSQARAECTGDDGGSSLVTDIRGGDTLILEDGRAVRLAGVLLPRRSSEGDVMAEARKAAEKAVADLVSAQKVELRLDTTQRDRYGRLLAQVFVTKDDQRVWLQERLIASGHARVISSKDNRMCIGDLLTAENTARQTGQGEWHSGVFSVKQAASEDILAGLVQNYEIVEGRIENVAEVRGRTYLNFGKNWRRDFTVSISSDAAKLFAGQTELSGLKGRLVRVRGWIENINGPSIALTHPEQLEVLESGTALHR